MPIAAPDPLYEAALVNVQECLAEHGWAAAQFTAVAVREVHTAIGPKVAQATLLKVSAEGPFLLSGTYFSEGRNILAGVMMPIPRVAGPREIGVIALRFAQQSDAVIGACRDVRVLRPAQ